MAKQPHGLLLRPHGQALQHQGQVSALQSQGPRPKQGNNNHQISHIGQARPQLGRTPPDH